ncbi:MAG: FAD:protein FMN transferase [Actinomycetota bacterium]|jgi:thiamine biosynthesis lipoprotein|nr:FAD:protein FMN transferase [Actinomycetota bacterium]
MRRTTSLLTSIALTLSFSLTGCSRAPEPVRDAREALGTIVSITAYGEDEGSVRDALDDAYEIMSRIEAEIDAHNTDSRLSAYNRGEAALPVQIGTVESAIQRLDVDTWFSLGLFDVTQAWSFETGGRVPTRSELDAALRTGTIDAGGAAKGLALDAAAESLRGGSVTAALLTAGSTTVTFGSKPDGSAWRIGVEDPRDPSAIVAVIEAEADVTVSTSGDYQRYFESDGTRYHHILDPRTGLPAMGLRSLTVVGSMAGLDSDILSTALFVAGAEDAEAYAVEHELGLFMVNDQGRAQLVPGPSVNGWRVVRETEPTRH